MTPACYWILNHADRILSFIAIVIAVVAMLDVRHLSVRQKKELVRPSCGNSTIMELQCPHSIERASI